MVKYVDKVFDFIWFNTPTQIETCNAKISAFIVLSFPTGVPFTILRGAAS